MRSSFKRFDAVISVGVIASVVGAFALAHAQDGSSPAQSVARVEAAMHRVQDDAECLGRKKQELERVMILIRDALSQAGGTGTASRDGAAAVESLVARAAGIEREAIACVHREPLLVSTAPVVQTVTAPAEGNVAAVAQENAATRVIERDVRLSADLTIVLAEQVDGTGRIGERVVINGMRDASSRISSCFGEAVGRRGEMALSYTITSSGRVSGVSIEGDTLGVASVSRCVRTAASSLRFSEGARGGDAVISYTLRYGAR